MKIRLQSIVLFFAAGLVQLSAYGDVVDDNVFATVNDQRISADVYGFLLGTRERELLADTEYAITAEDEQTYRSQTAKDLILTEVLAQEAQRLKLDEDPMVQAELQISAKTLMAQLAVKRIIEKANIDEAQMRQIYEGQANLVMYRFNIWVAQSEADAKKLFTALTSGENSEQLSSLTENPFEVIETPWLRDVDIDPATLDDVTPLAVGEFASHIIKKDADWRVVKLIDKNVLKKQDYELERESIKAELTQIYVDKAIAELSQKAKIELNKNHGAVINENWINQ